MQVLYDAHAVRAKLWESNFKVGHHDSVRLGNPWYHVCSVRRWLSSKASKAKHEDTLCVSRCRRRVRNSQSAVPEHDPELIREAGLRPHPDPGPETVRLESVVERRPQGILRQVHVHEQMKIKPRELEQAREKAGIDVWMRERERDNERERRQSVRQADRQTG